MNRLRALPTWWRAAFAVAVFVAVSGAMALAVDVQDGTRDMPRTVPAIGNLGFWSALGLAIAAWRMQPGDAPTRRPGVFVPERLWMLQLVAWVLPAVLLPIPFFFGALWGTPRLVTVAMVIGAVAVVGLWMWLAFGIRYEVTDEQLVVRLPWPKRYALRDITGVEELDRRRIALKLADQSDVALGRPEDFESFREMVLGRR